MKKYMLLLLLFALPACASTRLGRLGPFLPVARVIDGDTLVVRRAEREVHVRLQGVDAPETPGGRQGKHERCGDEATLMLKALAGNAFVRLEEHGLDRYGRTLAVVYVPTKEGVMVNVNAAVVATGFARAALQYKPAHAGELRAAEDDAKARSVGLWGPEGACAPVQ